MKSSVMSLGLRGIDGFIVNVEAYLSAGLPAFEIVGLPDSAVRESKERVRAAMKNSNLGYPAKRITINLAPGDVKKEGPIYDLPILVSLLLAEGLVGEHVADNCAFIGELSLDGGLRPMRGALPLCFAAKERGVKTVYLPAQNAAEGAAVPGIEVMGVESLWALLSHFSKEEKISPQAPAPFEAYDSFSLDFADVKGQDTIKRAMEVAAAGFHNLLMIGPPGAGKSMLAKRLPTILPTLDHNRMIESTKIYSVAGLTAPDRPMITEPPFRSPHHTVSAVGLSGGGRIPSPGEISLSHNGVLFLDELPEFSKSAMEVLRQPMEDGVVTISRAGGTLTFPSSFMLVCAMNPCRCGYFGHPSRRCSCPPGSVPSYIGKISGPLLDRIDIHIEVPPVEFDDLSGGTPSKSSSTMRANVAAARARQRERWGAELNNARLTSALIQKHCPLGDPERALLRSAFERLGLSARAYERIIRLSRTVADLEGSDDIKKEHILEALQYRSLDRKYWRG